MPTDDVSALARLREKLARMTPGPWLFDHGRPDEVVIWTRQPHIGVLAVIQSEDINGEFPAKANAAGIVHAVSLARFVADEQTVERVARMIDWAAFDSMMGYEEGLLPEQVEGTLRNRRLKASTKARAFLALIASAGEEA